MSKGMPDLGRVAPILESVARGFESKDVEQQQQEAEERRAAAKRVAVSAELAEVERKRDGLQLQRTRILREIESSSNERHRKTLESGLAYLDEQLGGLGVSTEPAPKRPRLGN